MTESELPDYQLTEADAADIVGKIEETPPVDLVEHPGDHIEQPDYHDSHPGGDYDEHGVDPDGVEITEDDEPGEN